jgi:hypothetical protein
MSLARNSSYASPPPSSSVNAATMKAMSQDAENYRLASANRLTSIHGFLGTCGLVWIFIEDFAKYTHPLVNLMCKDIMFHFRVEEIVAIDTIKDLVIVRGHLSVSLPFLSSPTLPLFIGISLTPLYHPQGPHPKLTTFVFKV